MYVHVVTTGIFESRENSLVVPWYQLQVTTIVNTDNSFQNGFAKKNLYKFLKHEKVESVTNANNYYFFPNNDLEQLFKPLITSYTPQTFFRNVYWKEGKTPLTSPSPHRCTRTHAVVMLLGAQPQT